MRVKLRDKKEPWRPSRPTADNKLDIGNCSEEKSGNDGVEFIRIFFEEVRRAIGSYSLFFIPG